MQLSKEAIAEFQALYAEEFQEELLSEEAALMASELLELYALLIPHPLLHGKSSNDQ